MTSEKFNALLCARQEKTWAVMVQKRNEYATDKDVLHNFKRAATISEQTVVEAWYGMWLKHLVSLLDMIHSSEIPSQEWIDEKIGDTINYLHLLEGLYEDARDTSDEGCRCNDSQLTDGTASMSDG